MTPPPDKRSRPQGTNARVAVVLTGGMAGALVGCGGDLPMVERIASTRPLAARVEVIDPTAAATDPVRAEGLPFEAVRIVPFIVDPEGPLDADTIAAEIEPVWLGCALQPIEGVFACLSSKLPLQPQDVPECPEVSVPGPDATAIPMYPSPCRITGGTPGQPELTIPLDVAFLIGGDLEVTMVGHAPGDGDTDRCLEALLTESADIPDACIFATMRVPVGPDARIAQLAADFGFVEPEDLGPQPDEIPESDTHPRIQTFEVTVLDAQGNEVEVVQAERGDTIAAPLGGSLEIETTAPELDLQTYLIPSDEGFTPRDETYTGRWFITWGELLNPTSDDPLSMNTWTLRQGEQDEEETPAGDVATLYYVLRDDRQGVDWWWVHVAVE